MREIINSYYLPRYVFSKIPLFLKSDYRDYFRIRKLIKITEHFSSAEFKKYQYKRLKDIIYYAWENIEGYRNLWEDNNFHPQQFKSVDDLSLVPFILLGGGR